MPARKPAERIMLDIQRVHHEKPELLEGFRKLLSRAVQEGHIETEPSKEMIRELLASGSHIFLARNLKTKEPLGFGIIDPPGRSQKMIRAGIEKRKADLFPKLHFFRFLYSKVPKVGVGSAIMDKIQRDLMKEGALGIWSFAISQSGLDFTNTMKRKGYEVFDIGGRKGLDVAPVKIYDFESGQISNDEIYARIALKEFRQKKKP